jgi:hypothetical protein
LALKSAVLVKAIALLEDLSDDQVKRVTQSRKAFGATPKKKESLLGGNLWVTICGHLTGYDHSSDLPER